MFHAGDCHNAKGTENMCVVGAINNYTAQLRTYGKSSSGCKRSLRLIINIGENMSRYTD